MWKLILRIHRAVAGSESWYAAWQAFQAELRKRWPDALPSVASGIALMWTWLTGSALPWIALAGLVAYAAMYTVRVQSGLRPEENRTAIRHGAKPIAEDGPLAEEDEWAGATAGVTHEAHTEALGQLRAQVERLEKNIVRINGKHVAADRDLLIILDSMTYITGYMMFKQLESEFPPLEEWYEQKRITGEWLTEQKETADRYAGRVMRTLTGTSWGGDLGENLSHAGSEADRQIGQMPADRVPEGMDRFDLRPYFIARTQCEWTVAFLRRQIQEAEKTLDCHLTRLQERMAERRKTLT